MNLTRAILSLSTYGACLLIGRYYFDLDWYAVQFGVATWILSEIPLRWRRTDS